MLSNKLTYFNAENTDLITDLNQSNNSQAYWILHYILQYEVNKNEFNEDSASINNTTMKLQPVRQAYYTLAELLSKYNVVMFLKCMITYPKNCKLTKNG